MATQNSTGTTAQPAPRTKLTDHEVELIEEMLQEGMTLRQVAARLEEITQQ